MAALLALSGCQTVSYYTQAVTGQWRVLAKREPVPAVLERLAPQRATDPQADLLYRRLVFTQAALDFAESSLALPVEGRYRSYVDLGRPAVLWNLFAAPALSLEPHQWCYPLVGCAPYRGYFDQAMAERSAAAFEARGLDTYLGAVPAYSTLGWFDDPLLSTFVTWPEPDLARLLFHELAHGVVWLPGDVAFNESFATFVGRRGLAEWRAADGTALSPTERIAPGLDGPAFDGAVRAFRVLLARTRSALESLYASSLPDPAKLRLKQQTLEAARLCYRTELAQPTGGLYDDFMNGLNNARLVSIATYEDLVPAFARLFDAEAGDWPAFFARVRAVAELAEPDRRRELGLSGDEQVAAGGDDHGSEQVQCEPLAGHLLDAEAAGGVHDDVGSGGHG